MHEEVPVQLSLSLSGTSADTKANVDYITELANDGRFRGMTDIRILAFGGRSGVSSGDSPLGIVRSLPSISGTTDKSAYTGSSYHKGLVRNNHAHLYSDAYAAFPLGAASVLIYGKAVVETDATEQDQKHLNGSLMEDGLEVGEAPGTSEISFSPDPIYAGTASETAAAMATILTNIVSSATYTQTYYYKRNGVWYSGTQAVSWDDDIDDPTLREYFNWITGSGQLMTGAGGNLEYMLSFLYQRLKRYESDNENLFMHLAGGVEYQAYLDESTSEPLTYAMLYDGLKGVILRRFASMVDSYKLRIDGNDNVYFASYEQRYYPILMGLPSGAAVLRWNGLSYVVVREGLDGIAPIDRFCYMPPLYYFANTTISTSGDAFIYKKFTESVESWSQILSNYRLGKVVGKSTRAVALDQPLQYACGLLSATVTATSPVLQDADGDPRTYCEATGTNFPVTGIIIGSQFRQSFDFRPDESAPEFYLYDNRISGVYLTATESADFRTLVLPVPEGRDVYFFIELRNDSGSSFTGAEGLILPGNYFYLAGKLEKSDDPAFPSVFMSDHITTVHCTVSSMEHAHVSVPELGQPQMVLGVQSRLNWIMSAASYVVLD